MKFLDMNDFKRKKHFDFFIKLDYPQMNLCANVEITRLHDFLKNNKLPFYYSLIYLSLKTANQIKEFRHRICDCKIIEHEIIHPSFSIMAEDDMSAFAHQNILPIFTPFCKMLKRKLKK